MRKLLLALLIVMLALTACVSNKTYKAQQAKVQILEARQNNQDAELEMARKDIVNNREKLDQLVIRVNGVDEQLLVLEPMQDEIVNSATALVSLQGEVATINTQLNEAIATNAKLEQKLTALTTDTNDTFDAYSDYLKQMKDSQSEFATKAEIAQLAAESSQLAQVLDDLTTEVESIALNLDEQDAILAQLGEFADEQATFNANMALENESLLDFQAAQASLNQEQAMQTSSQQKSAAQEKEELWTEITRIRGELTTSQNELYTIRQTLASDVVELKQSDAVVKTEMNDLRDRVYTVNSDLTVLTTDLQAVIVKERAAAEKRRLEAMKKQYKAALAAYNKGKHENSILLFEDFLKAYPEDELSPNAYYWIAENYYSAANFPKALRQFQEVVDRYPGHAKAWDAQLKIGLTYFQMKDYESTYTELMMIKNYKPDYPQMKIVDKYLKKI